MTNPSTLAPQVLALLDTLDAEKRTDSLHLIALMSLLTGQEAKLGTSNMIGFGTYHYKYASGHEGDTAILAFAPRKDKFSLYLSAGADELYEPLSRLGKHKMGKGCLYIKQLSDVDLVVLKELCKATLKLLKARYPYQSILVA